MKERSSDRGARTLGCPMPTDSEIVAVIVKMAALDVVVYGSGDTLGVAEILSRSHCTKEKLIFRAD